MAASVGRRNRGLGRERERGAILVFTGVVLTALLAFTAIAIDLGYQRVARRDMQALADVVALDLVRMVDGRTAATIELDPLWDEGLAASVARNDDTQGDDLDVVAELGTVDASRNFTVVTGTAVPNAVRVTASATTKRFFSPTADGKVSRSAIAGGDDATVDYQLGSFLAGLSSFQNGLLQRILSQAFCPDGSGGASCRAALDVLSYQGLVNTRVTLGALAAQLGFASPEQLLASNVSVPALLSATAVLLPAGTPPTAAATLNGIAARLTSSSQIRLGDFVDVVQGGENNAAQASLDVLGIILGSAFLIDGDSAATIPGATVSIPNVLSMTVRLRVIETVQYRFGARVGDPPLTTGQIQLDVTTQVSGINVLGLVQTLGGTQTISVVVGGASAAPTLARCGSPKRAEIAVTPQPVSVTASQQLQVLGLSLGGIDIQLVTVNMNNVGASLTGATQTGGFNYTTGFLPPVGTGTTQRLGSTSLGLSSLLRPAQSHVNILGIIPLDLGTLTTNIGNALNPVLTAVDNLLIDPLAKALGLNLGGGDVGAIDLHCTGDVALIG